MLINDLYQLQDLQISDHSISGSIVLNPENQIFSGHYPHQPVLPGACMLQIIKEVLEHVLGQQLQLVKAAQLKFLQMVDPGVNPVLQVKITYQETENNQYKVTASLSANDTVCFKMQAISVLKLL